VYARFKEIFSSDRWRRLAARGAHVQRPLWASTSTKNPNYPDTLYVDSLIGPMTVNTLPQETYDAFLDHGVPAMTVECGLDEARQRLARLAELGISLDQVTEQLQVDGVASFAKSFEDLSNSVAEKCEKIRDT
jgi:transaldolase